MKLCGFDVGLDQPFFLIAGPCVIESAQLQMDVAGQLKEITASLDEQGPLGTVRLYLPGGQAPVEVDWIEVVPAQGKGQRWSFDEAP